MIEHASYNDGRTLTIITKLNEVIDEVNSLRRDFEAMALNFDNHTHVTIPVDGGIITDGPYQTGGPLVAMIDERQEGQMPLTPEEIQALLKKDLVKATGGSLSQLPRPIQLGPLRWLDKSSNCRSRNCNSPCMIQVRGVSYCTTHALNALNEIILRELQNVDLDSCNCKAGGYSKGNIHSVDCTLYQLEVKVA